MKIKLLDQKLFKGVHECFKNLMRKVIPLTDYVNPTLCKCTDYPKPFLILEYYCFLSTVFLKDIFFVTKKFLKVFIDDYKK